MLPKTHPNLARYRTPGGLMALLTVLIHSGTAQSQQTKVVMNPWPE